MRRRMVTCLALPTLLVAGCSGDSASDGPAAADQAPASQTQQPGSATSDPGPEEGGEEGRAAADRAEQFLSAFVRGDAAACDYMVNLGGTAPMNRSGSDLEVCERSLVAESQEVFDEETASVLEAMEIRGADVQGDTATIDADNLSDLFADGVGTFAIVLRQFDDEWYVDMTDSWKPS